MGQFYRSIEFERIHPEILDGNAMETPDFDVQWNNYRIWTTTHAMMRWVGVQLDVPTKAGRQLLAASQNADGGTAAFDDVDGSGQTLLQEAQECIRDAATAFMRHARVTVAPYAGGFGLGGPIVWQLSTEEADKHSSGTVNLKFIAPREARRVHTHITPDEFQLIETSLRSGSEVPESSTFFSVAQDLFERRSNGAATIALAVAAETALKQQLAAAGGEIATYLLENTQSPPIANLAAAAERHCGLAVDSVDRTVLQKLGEARNVQVHSPVARPVADDDLRAWFDVVNKILRHRAST